MTTYNYNSLGQVTTQNTPDAGTSKFWYDLLGRLVVSQNAKQFLTAGPGNPSYSYTKYDELGRIAEVGERVPTISLPTVAGYLTNTDVNSYLQSGYGTQVTQTFYDFVPVAPPAGFNTSLLLKNLRKRVAATVYREQDYGPVQQASYYSYDIAGNVHTLWQQIEGFGLKKINYEYDLVSGKVNTVLYQQGQADQFYYHYKYDAENTLIEAQSSTTAFTNYNLTTELLQPQTDAVYKYYPHGPLARVELGHNKVQGIDYAYTLQGWLKGINGHRISSETTDGGDIGNDGKAGTPYVNNARDIMSYTLGYYFGDYKPVGTVATTPAFSMPFAGAATGFGANLYNGNIGHTTVSLSQFNNGNPTGYTYKYDQLNRITAMQQHVLAANTLTWNNTTATTQAYAENYTYDANGNILTLNRNANKPTAWRMDELTYNYIPNSNKLGHVTDAVGETVYTDAEVKDMETQTPGNYQYDAIGNMISDVKEGITAIDWTVYGKISSITKTTGNSISYRYDAAGNRVQKSVAGAGASNATITYYVRDAQGNVLALYEQVNAGAITYTEQHLYGSSRLGIFKPVQPGITVAHRQYELTNHLGNVLATIGDQKIPVDLDNNQVIDFYLPEVLSQNDYYPFGMGMPGRRYTAGTGYRYGFNGKEEDKETTSTTTYDYGFRIYSPALGRFLSVDPLFKSYPWNSSYAFAENEPISNIDLDGLEKYKVTVRTFLPYTYVWEPQAKDIIDKANTRWYPQYKNVEAHGGFKSEQQFEVDFNTRTTTYLLPVAPGTFSKNLETGKVEFDRNGSLGDGGTMTNMFENRSNIFAEISTKNPATPGLMPTPAIDYGLNISVMKDGTWILNGKWDGFPALEVFIEDQETGQVDLMHFDNTSDAGKDLKDGNNPKEILNLFPVRGDTKINKVGQVGDRPQADKPTPSPKVEENNKRFSSNQDCKCDPKPRDHRGN